MADRQYNLSFAELIDRLQLVQMKENYGGDYIGEISAVLHDIDWMLQEGIKVDANIIRAIVAMTQANTEIWVNENNEREGVIDSENVDWEKKYKNLLRTHKLNATRSECKARVQELLGGRTDKKLNYHNTEWKISW